jgi:flavin reductase (DIM6/NTAB) family NADH-FMN oxidoreductase RutF
MKVKGNMDKYYYCAFPMQAVLVTCNDEKEKTNIITLAWHTPISKKPPLYGISVAPKRYSHDLIKKTKEFVINFLPYSLANEVNYCGTHSGRTTDKIEETKLNLVDSGKIKTPSIKEAFANMECKLFKTISLGDHTLFVGEIVNLLADENAFKDDLLKNEKMKPCYYLGSNIYTSIDKIRAEL